MNIAQNAVRAFTLTKDEIASLFHTIKTSISNTIRTVYNRNNDLTDSDTPVDLDQQIEQAAHEHVQSIVETYTSELENAVTSLTDAYTDANDGNMDNLTSDLADSLYSWSGARTDYKAEQIANYETGYAANMGTDQYVQDTALDPSQYGILITPAEASSDRCSQYAGNTYALDEDLPMFPLHPNCPHLKVLVSLDNGDA